MVREHFQAPPQAWRSTLGRFSRAVERYSSLTNPDTLNCQCYRCPAATRRAPLESPLETQSIGIIHEGFEDENIFDFCFRAYRRVVAPWTARDYTKAHVTALEGNTHVPSPFYGNVSYPRRDRRDTLRTSRPLSISIAGSRQPCK